MRSRNIALLFGLAFVVACRASESEPTASVDEYSVLTDGVDLDGLFLNANSSDPATSSASKKALSDIVRNNPLGKRRLSYGVVDLEIPSWDWDYNRKMPIHGIEVDFRRPNDSGADMASVLVDHLPGLSDEVIGNVIHDLPDGAKVSKEEITTLGQFTGSGTRVIVSLTSPTPQRTECVLFYPKNKIEGYYIFSMFSGPPERDEIERELGKIVQSIRVNKRSVQP